MNTVISKLVDYFTPSDLHHDHEGLRRVRMAIPACLIISVIMIVLYVGRLKLGVTYKYTNHIGLINFCIYLSLPFLIKKYPRKFELWLNMAMYLGAVTCFARSIETHFIRSMACLWFIPLQTLSGLYLRRSHTYIFSGVLLVMALALGYLNFKFNPAYTKEDWGFFIYFALVMAFTLYATIKVETERIIATRLSAKAQLKLYEKQKMASIGEMASGLAHEINNPLTVIMASAEIIAHETEKTQLDLNRLNRFTNKISSHSAKIKAIISNLKDYSQDESKIKMVPITLMDLIEDLPRSYAEKIKKNNIQVTIISKSRFSYTQGNENFLKRAIGNVFDNACDAVESLEEKWIKITLEDKNDHYAISIIDSGNGIPKEIQEKMMLAFFTTKDVGRGVGIGLLLSQKFLEFHKGHLKYELENGHTKFVLSIPKNMISEVYKAA